MNLEVIEYLPKTNSKKHPLLFIHGASHGAWCWKENFLPYFSSKGFSSYALSLRGHGESEGRDKIQSFSMNDYMGDVLEVMRRFNAKPILIGHSMGGAIVQKIVHQFPNSMAAMVLMSSVPPNGMLKDILRIIFSNYKALNQISLFNKGESATYPVDTLFSKKMPAGKRNELSRLLQPESEIARKEMGRQIVPKSISVQIPILILGSKTDWFFSEKTTLRMGDTYRTQPIIFSNLSHDMMFDPNWRTVADQILTFLDESIM